ncbi:MAG TPA: hypothetical protein VE641_21125 [Chthoniobacterales bacterium]|nr:hypothetical protein [Chthoniobacterales bacterium]
MQDSPEKGPNGRPEQPDDRHRVFWIYVLILGGGVVFFFLGGLLMRNPNLPSYLYSRVTSWLRNESSTPSSRQVPPPPKTAEDYLELTHYDVRMLPADQRGVALALADATGNAAAVQDRLTALEQNVRNDLPTLRSANALSAYAKMKPAATTLLQTANQQKVFFLNLETKLTQQFEGSGLHEDLAKQIAALFYQRTLGQKAVDQAAESEKLASELLAIANLLSETPNKWRVSSDGAIHAQDKKLDDEYRAHHEALLSVINR